MGKVGAAQEPLLSPNYPDDLEQDFEERGKTRKASRSCNFTRMLFFCSVITNLVLLSLVLSLKYAITSTVRIPLQSQPNSVLDTISDYTSPYSGLNYDTEVIYTHHTDFTSNNKTLSTEAWDSVADVLMIAVTEDWAKEKRLPPSLWFPWDTDKHLYFIKVGHQLHCLKSIRWTIDYILEHGANAAAEDLHMGHIDHCLDTLRQDVMCVADDTPMATLKYINGAGEGQVMQCKNFDRLLEWIDAPEQQSCHRHIKPWVGIKHGIERFAFCPEDSPYYPVMQEYFRVHGHLD